MVKKENQEKLTLAYLNERLNKLEKAYESLAQVEPFIVLNVEAPEMPKKKSWFAKIFNK